MGRRPHTPDAVPRLRKRRQKSGVLHYYYDHGGRPRREEPLGADYGLAILRWAELERERTDGAQVAAVLTVRYVADQYRARVMPGKAPRTQADNAKELKQLLAFFDDPPVSIDSIKPLHVHQYMRWRHKSPTRANREKALLSHMWNFARSQGYTDLPNPCTGIDGYSESGRDVYIDDAMFAQVYALAAQPLRDAMDLLYLTGQRPADVLRMAETAIREDALEVRQSKTKAKLRIAITGELLAVVERIRARKRACAIYSTRLIVDEQGRQMSLRMIQDRFKSAREAAGIAPNAFQLRDLRAKAGTDKTDSGDIRQAQQQLGHGSVVMTEHYVRGRRGAKVTPTK